MSNILSDIGNLGDLFLSAVGAVTGLEAQKQANRSNLQIARETNAQQLDMFNRQLQFNSFESQRAMLEAAGYSPFSLFNAGSVSAPSSPSLNVPTMIPENALANSFLGIADMARSFAEARKLNAEATSKDIENEILPDLLDIQREGGMNDNIYKDLQNKILHAQKEDLVSTPALNNKLIIMSTEVSANQAALLAIQSGLLEEYGHRKNEAELEEMASRAYAQWQKGNLDAEELKFLPDKYQSMLDTAHATLMNAETNKEKAPSEIASNYASADYSRQLAAFTKNDVDALKKYGLSPAVIDILQKHSQTKLNYRQRSMLRHTIDQIDEDVERLRKENNYRSAEHAAGLMQKLQDILSGNMDKAGSLLR